MVGGVARRPIMTKKRRTRRKCQDIKGGEMIHRLVKIMRGCIVNLLERRQRVLDVTIEFVTKIQTIIIIVIIIVVELLLLPLVVVNPLERITRMTLTISLINQRNQVWSLDHLRYDLIAPVPPYDMTSTPTDTAPIIPTFVL
jgi:hypothetical protein